MKGKFTAETRGSIKGTKKRRIQMIYQMADTAMNPRQSVREIIGRPLEFYLGMTGFKKDARVLELLEMIELDGRFLDRLPGELSGGQNKEFVLLVLWRQSQIL